MAPTFFLEYLATPMEYNSIIQAASVLHYFTYINQKDGVQFKQQNVEPSQCIRTVHLFEFKFRPVFGLLVRLRYSNLCIR